MQKYVKKCGVGNMNVIELLKARKATRAISEEKLSEEIVRDLIEAARLTPSCFNKQPWKFLFLENEGLEKGREVLTGGNRKWANRAPLLVIVYAKPQHDCQNDDGRDYHRLSMGMASMNIMLTATEQGLVARPMAGFDPQMVRDLFSLEKDDDVMLIIAIGYQGEDESHLPDYYQGLHEKDRTRKNADEIVARL